MSYIQIAVCAAGKSFCQIVQLLVLSSWNEIPGEKCISVIQLCEKKIKPHKIIITETWLKEDEIQFNEFNEFLSNIVAKHTRKKMNGNKNKTKWIGNEIRIEIEKITHELKISKFQT